MKLKYKFFFCSYFFLLGLPFLRATYSTDIKTNFDLLSATNVNDDSNNKVESLRDLLQKQQLIEESLKILNSKEINKEAIFDKFDFDKLKETLLKMSEVLENRYSSERTVNVVVGNKESEEFYARKNAIAKLGTRYLLLKVIIPFAVSVVIFYLLSHYYKNIVQSTWPKCLSFEDLGPWDFTCKVYDGCKTAFTTDWGQKLRSFWRQILEISVAVSRLYVVGKKPNSIVVDGLRITSSSLFLINKDQFSMEAFKQGGYYTQGWLLYDLFHLIKTFYSDGVSKVEATDGSIDFMVDENKKDIQYKQISDLLCYYFLPFAEFATSLYLSLHITETPASIKARKNMQAVYSLVRMLPVYLKEKRDSVDVLLTANLLIVALDFWRTSSGFGKNNGNNDKTENKKPEDLQDEKEDDEKINPPQEPPTDEPETDSEKDFVSDKTGYGKEEERQFVSQEKIQEVDGFKGGHITDNLLVEDLKKLIDHVKNAHPELKNIDPAEFNLNLDEHSTNIEPFDNRRIGLILEEKLKSCDEHIKELKAMGYITDDELKAMGYTRG